MAVSDHHLCRRRRHQGRRVKGHLSLVCLTVLFAVGCFREIPGRFGGGSDAISGLLVAADLYDLIDFMNKLEIQVQEFAAEVERAYQNRCNSTAWKNCEGSQYNACRSALGKDSTHCPLADEGPQLHLKACGDGIACNGIVDFTSSAVRVPQTTPDNANGTPDDLTVVETVCFGSLYDEEMKQRFTTMRDAMRNNLGVKEAPFLFFGASDGTFRIYPARPIANDCAYDPRQRSWYVGASSSPKAILIVVDISGYPKDAEFEHVMATARAFINTVTVTDRIGVVFMGEEAKFVNVSIVEFDNSEGHILHVGSDRVRAELRRSFREQTTTTTPDMEGAFKLAFDTIERTVTANLVDCNVALVVLTSEMNMRLIPVDLILKRIRNVESLTGRPMLFFGYNTGNALTQESILLECRLNAVWSNLDLAADAYGIVQAVRLFHEAFATNLGATIVSDTRATTGMVIWSEPYAFLPGNTHGTTVASPVYDGSVSPPLFLGVVGIDFSLESLQKILGEPESRRNVRRQIHARRPRRCGPPFRPCALEALRRRARRFSGVEDGTSRPVCVNLTDINQCKDDEDVPITERTVCEGDSALPSTLWANLDDAHVEYLNRSCCTIGVEKTTIGDEKVIGEYQAQCPNADTVPTINAVPSPPPLPPSPWTPERFPTNHFGSRPFAPLAENSDGNRTELGVATAGIVMALGVTVVSVVIARVVKKQFENNTTAPDLSGNHSVDTTIADGSSRGVE